MPGCSSKHRAARWFQHVGARESLRKAPTHAVRIDSPRSESVPLILAESSFPSEKQQGAAHARRPARKVPPVPGSTSSLAQLAARFCRLGLIAVVALAGSTQPVYADTVVLNPMKDNTLFQSSGTGGETSTGAGVWLFTGRTGGMGGGIIRRSLFAFDIAAQVPAGSTIDDAALTLVQLDAGSGVGSIAMGIHRVGADWGEGTSSAGGGLGAPATPGDATWTLGFYPDSATAWTSPGGDYDAAALATTSVSASDFSQWTWGSTPALIEVVQEWLDDPSENFGVLLRNQNEGPFSTSIKWASGEDPFSTPELVIEFTPPPSQLDFIRGDCNTDGVFQVSDAVWGLTALFVTGDPLLCADACDINDDSSVDIADFIYGLEYLFTDGPAPPAPNPTCGADSGLDGIGCDAASACP